MTADPSSVVHRNDLRSRPDDGLPHLADPYPSLEATANHLSPNGVPLCGVCNDVIGVYEPLVRVLEGSVRHTSRAAEPLPPRSGERWYHLRCYESLDHER